MHSKEKNNWSEPARAWFASQGSPAAFTRGAIKTKCEELAGRRFSVEEVMTNINKWERDGLARKARSGLWLNIGKKPAGKLDDLLGLARPGSVASMHSILGACGAHHNPSVMAFGVLPGKDCSELGSLDTKAGRMRFFTLPQKFFEQEDWLVGGARHARFKPEKALLDWIWLGQAPTCEMAQPNQRDIDLDKLDLGKAEGWARSLGMPSELASWLHSHPHSNEQAKLVIQRAKADGHEIRAELSAKMASGLPTSVRDKARDRGLAR